ncbi:MAG: VCBS repeat-containing protein, partial [Candidatus Acidiferrum sp.]
MNLLRRRFLGSSGVLLGSTLLDALASPLWKWKRSLLAEAAPAPHPLASNPGVSASPTVSPVVFVDVAREAGLNSPNVWGGIDRKQYIIEAKGSGLAFFDYDNDGWLDIYFTNGTRFNTDWPAGKAPTSHLYKNNRDGTFTDVTEKSGLARTGWQTGVCVGDYDND